MFSFLCSKTRLFNHIECVGSNDFAKILNFSIIYENNLNYFHLYEWDCAIKFNCVNALAFSSLLILKVQKTVTFG